ncbi:MAG: hypothetical protein ACM31L_12500 [Actinomycetota bacterium]
MNFQGLDNDAYIAIGFVGVLLVITVGLFVFVWVQKGKKHGDQ